MIRVVVGSQTDLLKLQITLGEKEYIYDEAIKGKKEIMGKNSVRIRFDKVAADTPYIYLITVE